MSSTVELGGMLWPVPATILAAKSPGDNTFRRPPRWPVAALVLIVLVLALNLFFVTRQVARANQELAEYTAARELIGPGHTMFVVQEVAGVKGDHELANPLLPKRGYLRSARRCCRPARRDW